MSKPKKTYIDTNGYLRFEDSDKLVHRWIVEKSIGRRLYFHEVVHHKDGNKLNNNRYNLQVFSSQEEHHALHQRRKILRFFLPKFIFRMFWR